MTATLIACLPALARLPPEEGGRLDALRHCDVLDTPPESQYDDLTRLAATICGTPISLISLIDNNRQWVKSRHGLGATETPRDISFCNHAILQDELLVVPDAREDERFADNPLVTSEPHIRFYAGVPLTDPDGFNLGTLCVIDRLPRQLTPAQREALGVLARQVVALLLMRRQIRDLEKARADLCDSEGRFRAFMDNSPAVAFMKDADGRYVYHNEPFRNRFGIRGDDWIGKTDAELFPPGVARTLRQNDLDVMAGGETVELLETVPTPDGIPHHWQVYKFPLTDSGREKFLAGLAVDVTAKKNAEDALRESEERFRSVVEELAEGVVLIDAKTKAVLRANRAFLNLLGYNNDGVAGRTLYDFVDHARGDIDDKVASIIAARRRSLGFRRYRHKDGTRVDVTVSGSLLLLGARPLVCLVVRNVTAEKASQDALRASEAKFRNTVDRLAEGVFVVDVATRTFVEANSSLLCLLGYKAGEFAALSPFDLVAGESREVYDRNVGLMDATLFREGRCDLGRKLFRRADGTEVTVDVRVTLVPNGGAGLYAVIVRDLTQELETEAHLLAYQAELEQANARLRLLAHTDGLTGIHNRSSFDERLKEGVGRASRYVRPLSLLLLDVDHFKLFNDAFGHPAGDEVLKTVARTLAETVRTTDVVARYGGEEFALILTDTDEVGAMVLAERCRRAVADVAWDKRLVTVSVGAGTLSPGSADAAGLVREADEALYRSKQTGRNRVTHKVNKSDSRVVPVIR